MEAYDKRKAGTGLVYMWLIILRQSSPVEAHSGFELYKENPNISKTSAGTPPAQDIVMSMSLQAEHTD